LKQLKRKRKHDIDDDASSIPDIKHQISDPIDLSQSYDSIRRRNSQMPPSTLPTALTSSEKATNGYGPLSVTNSHYRSSLIATGKPSSLSTLIEGDV
jgi:hypothetical protein